GGEEERADDLGPGDHHERQRQEGQEIQCKLLRLSGSLSHPADREERRRMRLGRSCIWAALMTAVLGLAAAATAAADSATSLGGSPLNVYVGERGQLQATRTDSSGTSGIFYPSTDPVGDAGFFLAFPSGYPGEPVPHVFG